MLEQMQREGESSPSNMFPAITAVGTGGSMGWGYEDEGGRRARWLAPTLSPGTWLRKARRNRDNTLPVFLRAFRIKLPGDNRGKTDSASFPPTMSIHRTTVLPAFEPGAAPDHRQLSPYAFFARPLFVAASHSLQNDSRPCYDPLLAVCTPGQGNSFSDVLALVSRREAEALQFATFQAHFFQIYDLQRRSNDVRSVALIPPPFPLHPFSHTLRMQGSTHLLKDKAEREELAPICWSKAHLHFRFLGCSVQARHELTYRSHQASRVAPQVVLPSLLRCAVLQTEDRYRRRKNDSRRKTCIRLRKIPDPLHTFDTQKMGDGLQRRA
ncbi:hypothetical protein C8F01DRAFT_1084289 [Mycena amicta]|nr:hypothetical protein C8F01DRAFT_1084289 [Mycena amicta]